MSDTTSASSAPSPSPGEKRQHLRFDKVFPVRVESILFGDLSCVARNVSAGGIFIENHYFMNYSQNGTSRSVIGMAVRFTAFEQESQGILRECLDRLRVLH
jgi:hypothetical protein